jgi:phosphopantothenoylcysteine decarboxylase/phosphopantothenate--cysteine ligase
MGFAVARAAREAGAEVTLVTGPVALPAPTGVHRIDLLTARQMHAEVMARVGKSDVFIAVAAVADWRVANASPTKLKKGKEATPPSLQFVANPDILTEVAARADAPFCVGFAAESERVVEHAQAKRAAKGVPLIVANRAQDALGAADSELFLIDTSGVTELPRADKLAQARLIVAAIAERLRASP